MSHIYSIRASIPAHAHGKLLQNTCNHLYSAISHKTKIFIITAMRTTDVPHVLLNVRTRHFPMPNNKRMPPSEPTTWKRDNSTPETPQVLLFRQTTTNVLCPGPSLGSAKLQVRIWSTNGAQKLHRSTSGVNDFLRFVMPKKQFVCNHFYPSHNALNVRTPSPVPDGNKFNTHASAYFFC